MSTPEQRAAWREASRRRRDKIYADPELHAAWLEKTKRWHSNHVVTPQKHRERNIRNSYGITAQEATALWAKQGHRCPGCEVELPDPGAPVTRQGCHIDHCHTTGKVRGVLCRACNLALGHAKDVPSTLWNLAQYLEKNQ